MRGKKLGLAALMLGALLFALGFAGGGYTDTLNKAAVICLECIGIG